MRTPRASAWPLAVLLSLLPAAASGDSHVIPNEEFCAAVSEDVAACTALLEELAAAGTVPEAFAGPVTSPAGPPDAVAGEARVIEFDADAALRFIDDAGEKVLDIPVTPGETVRFQIGNTAGFSHSFYIGQEVDVSGPGATTDVGVPAWSRGPRELTWTVPPDVEGLQFACTVPGHYPLMHGTISLST